MARRPEGIKCKVSELYVTSGVAKVEGSVDGNARQRVDSKRDGQSRAYCSGQIACFNDLRFV
jgi:hypothetical protein